MRASSPLQVPKAGHPHEEAQKVLEQSLKACGRGGPAGERSGSFGGSWKRALESFRYVVVSLISYPSS